MRDAAVAVAVVVVVFAVFGDVLQAEIAFSFFQAEEVVVVFGAELAAAVVVVAAAVGAGVV